MIFITVKVVEAGYTVLCKRSEAAFGCLCDNGLFFFFVDLKVQPIIIEAAVFVKEFPEPDMKGFCLVLP